MAPWTCFDVGGWDGIPGYLPEFLACTDALTVGLGYRQRIPFVSDAIGMDTYTIAQLRAGNGYDGFIEYSEKREGSPKQTDVSVLYPGLPPGKYCSNADSFGCPAN